MIARPENAEQRIHKDFAECKGADRHNNQQHERVVQNDACLLVLFFAEANRKERIAAHPNDHGHRHNKEHDGEAERNSRNAERTDSLTDKVTVNDIVKGVHAHADDRGNGEHQDKLGDAC